MDDVNENGDGWTMSEWSVPETPATATETGQQPATNPAQIAEELRHLTRRIDVMDLVTIVCSICLDEATTQRLLMDCGHILCSSCLRRQENDVCPTCRTPIGRTTPIQTGAFQLAWKVEVANAFGTRNIAADSTADGTRPGDLTWTQQLEIDSENLARELEMQDQQGLNVVLITSDELLTIT